LLALKLPTTAITTIYSIYSVTTGLPEANLAAQQYPNAVMCKCGNKPPPLRVWEIALLFLGLFCIGPFYIFYKITQAFSEEVKYRLGKARWVGKVKRGLRRLRV